MAKPIYKCIMGKFTEAFYQLNKEERKNVYAKIQDIYKQIGSKAVLSCYSGWATEKYDFFAVEEFPDIEAVQKSSELEVEIRRYFNTETTLGISFDVSLFT